VSPGAEEVSPPSTYEGVSFRHSNGSTFGLRFSDRYGLTYDVIGNDHPIFGPGYKVHIK
jgi:hypothetical protein